MSKLSRKSIASAVADEWVKKGVKRGELINQLSALLIEEGRKNEIDLVVEDVKAVLFERYGIVIADVYSKNALTASNKTNLTDLVKKKLDAKKIVINEHIDDSLLGGAFIATPSFSWDMTINSKLDKLRSV